MSGSEGIGLVGKVAKLRRDTPRNGYVLARAIEMREKVLTEFPA